LQVKVFWMLNEELKDYLGKELKLNTYEIKEHINDVNDKAREDFNEKFKDIDNNIKLHSERIARIESDKKSILWIAFSFIGLGGFVGWIIKVYSDLKGVS
jgi:hypothetical protein